MKTCQSCGYQNKDNAKFCSSCGYNLPENTETQYDFNPDNNNNYQDNNQTYQQPTTQPNTYQPNYTPPKKKNAIIAIILNCIGGIFFYFLAGIGQIYLGLFKRGLVIGAVGLLITLFNVAIILVVSEAVGTILSLIMGIALIIYSSYDAHLCTQAINEGHSIPLLFGQLDLE
ncbi:zinc-ribbon domain-containing protein [Methanosphaera sp. ISO3-F5]|uniref:zinc-ribbon domain-containing protein n=1 Tax=Methanosphaera sp. ISO3-F5 TaxID=1452353 RepID=UPI002B25D440|nr:zinc-ribbon domain-containing protein [Methanosphaera sp. ISO3-F5]WQH63718.1 zinc-ribbon domain-containing protein [Methanosphaera sp. ISO3-F5]